MYCPVDGMEYREGITRCPEHDVDLVPQPPTGPELDDDEDESWLERVGLEGVPGIAAIVVALAGVVYAVAGTIFSLWTALGTSAELLESAPVKTARFAQSASWAIGLGAFGCLAALVLARAYVRLQEPPARPEEEEEDDEDDLPPESPSSFVPVVSTLTICFAVVWMGLAIAVAWKTRSLGDGLVFQSSDSDNGLGRLFAYQAAAAACTLGSLAVTASLLMARAHDRLTWDR